MRSALRGPNNLFVSGTVYSTHPAVRYSREMSVDCSVVPVTRHFFEGLSNTFFRFMNSFVIADADAFFFSTFLSYSIRPPWRTWLSFADFVTTSAEEGVVLSRRISRSVARAALLQLLSLLHRWPAGVSNGDGLPSSRTVGKRKGVSGREWAVVS